MSPGAKKARTIVVTGGAEGIGRAVVLHCATRGDNLAVLDKNAEGATMTAEEAMKRGAGSAMGLFCGLRLNKARIGLAAIPSWTSASRIVRFPRVPHNAFATRAGHRTNRAFQAATSRETGFGAVNRDVLEADFSTVSRYRD